MQLSSHPDANRLKTIAASISLLVGISILCIKFFAYHTTGSSAILSDAIESIVNVLAAIVAFASIRFAAKPPDTKHPLGHGKIEYVAAGIEGFFILIAAVGVFYSGILQIIDPRPLPHLAKGSILILTTALMNLLLGLYLIGMGRKYASLTLRADGRHVLTDTMSSAGVLIGLWITTATGWFMVDGIVACVMGIWILFAAYGLLKEALQGLLDTTDPTLWIETEKILAIYATPQQWSFQQVRVWQISGKIYVGMKMVALCDTNWKEAHTYAHVVEDALVSHFKGNCSVLIHIEPAD